MAAAGRLVGGFWNGPDPSTEDRRMAKVTAHKDKDDPTYLIVINDSYVYEMSDRATAPNGVNMYVGSPSEYALEVTDHISLHKLPPAVLVAIIDRI